MEHDLEQEIGNETVSFICASCNKDITSDEMTKAVSCLQCKCSCHFDCLSEVSMCSICEKQSRIKDIRKGVK